MDFFKKNKILFIVFIIACGLIVMWGRSVVTRRSGGASARRGLFAKKMPEKPGEIIPVKTVKAAKMDYRDTITSFGTIKGFAEIPIKFRETDRVSKFYFKEGQQIKEGELVVSLEQGEQQAKLEYSEIEYEKNKKLYELGAITADKLRQTELEVESARAEVTKRNFYAPSNGLMGSRKLNEGELADPNTTVATFLDISSVFCEVGIIERDMGQVKVGQKAKIALETFSDETFEGAVDSVAPMIEGRSRTQTVRILIPNEKYVIKPGMFAKAGITTFEKQDAIVIPKSALRKTKEGYIVFGVIRSEEGPRTSEAGFELATAGAIPVQVERASENRALIRKGLEEGREIVLESPRAKENIKDGGTIEIIESEE